MDANDEMKLLRLRNNWIIRQVIIWVVLFQRHMASGYTVHVSSWILLIAQLAAHATPLNFFLLM